MVHIWVLMNNTLIYNTEETEQLGLNKNIFFKKLQMNRVQHHKNYQEPSDDSRCCRKIAFSWISCLINLVGGGGIRFNILSLKNSSHKISLKTVLSELSPDKSLCVSFWHLIDWLKQKEKTIKQYFMKVSLRAHLTKLVCVQIVCNSTADVTWQGVATAVQCRSTLPSVALLQHGPLWSSWQIISG